jgi:hypothetical protein
MSKDLISPRFKDSKKFKPLVPIDEGNINGPENIIYYKKILKEMKLACPFIDLEFAKCCIMTNNKNSFTSHY